MKAGRQTLLHVVRACSMGGVRVLLGSLLFAVSPVSLHAEKRLVPSSAGNAAVFIRIQDETGQITHVEVLDAGGQATRYQPVYGKHGELLQVKHAWGKHGEARFYRVVPDANGDAYFQTKPWGKHGEVQYVPTRKPPNLVGLNAGALGPIHMPVPPELKREMLQVQDDIREAPVKRIAPAAAAESIAVLTPEAHQAVQEFICTLGVTPEKDNRPIKEFICRLGAQPEQAREIVDFICTKGARPEAAPGPIKEFICTFGLLPEQADNVIEEICTKGVKPEDARPIVDFICTLGVDPAGAGRVVTEICVLRTIPVEQAQTVITEVCRWGGVPQPVTDEIIEVVCRGDEVPWRELPDRVAQICILRQLPAPVIDQVRGQIEISCAPPMQRAVDDYVEICVLRALPASFSDGYDPTRDVSDTGRTDPAGDLAQATTLLGRSQQTSIYQPGGAGAGAGDDGGYVVQPQVLGSDNVGDEAGQRARHTARPGDHAGRTQASTETGQVTDPFDSLGRSVGQVATAVQGVSDTIEGAEDVRDAIDGFGDDGHNGASHHPPAQAGQAAVHPPPADGSGGGGSGGTHKPAGASVKPPMSGGGHSGKPPASGGGGGSTASASGGGGGGPVGWAVYINHDFLGVGNKANFKPGREQIVHNVSTEQAGYAWLCPQLTITYYGMGGFDSSRAEFQGQEYRVRSNINEYCP
jgi:endonuclease V-like protein UPF0215 family